eukprot:545383-Prorocentrum_minimum.AAC.5
MRLSVNAHLVKHDGHSEVLVHSEQLQCLSRGYSGAILIRDHAEAPLVSIDLLDDDLKDASGLSAQRSLQLELGGHGWACSCVCGG